MNQRRQARNLLHDNLNSRNIHSSWFLAAIISVEAIGLEFLFNLSFLLIFGGYIFFYLPSGLWHLTAFQAIPFYFIAGFVIVKAIQGFKSDPWLCIFMNMILVSVLVFFTH